VAVRAVGTISATMQWTFFHTSTYSQTLALIVNGAPPGATVRLKCRGGGCPFAARKIAVGGTKGCGSKPGHRCGGHSAIDLAQWLSGAQLSVGTRITVEIVKPGWIGKQYVFTVRAGRAPGVQIACLGRGQTAGGGTC
jgi:hypothetical protein